MESEAETSKTKPLSKEETKGLLSLIEGSKILYNKKTNATSNKMKIEEWTRIAGTGGGPPGYFPPDEILDRVAALLGSTGEGLTVRWC
ncbi:unnamed protein product [Colias eurytheme]|nr:unnamed protein product [Colias eurytheme]